MRYALLDFDGYICKAWFASKSKRRADEHVDPVTIIYNLVSEAYSKTSKYFNTDKILMLPFVSGHTFKKDLYGDYKAHREKDDELKKFRDTMIERFHPIKSEQLEADDLISICIDALETDEQVNKCIVFSDDKDLKDLAVNFCKINITEEVQRLPIPDLERNDLHCRMLAGDKEDNITGIPKVGMQTAKKILKDEATIASVFKAYKDKGVALDEAIKQVTLVAPLSKRYNDYPMDIQWLGNQLFDGSETIDEDIVSEIVLGQVEFMNRIAKEIYNNEN